MSFGSIRPGVKNLLGQDCSWNGDQTWNGLGTFARENLATTTVSSVVIDNTTSATLTVPQASPSIQLRGRGWRSGTGVSQTVDFRSWVLPSNGNAEAIGEWKLQYSINNESYHDGLQYVTQVQDGVAVPKFKVNGFAEISGNNSSTIETLQNFNVINPSGNRTNITTTFGSTIKWGITVQDNGYTYYKAAGTNAQHNFQIGSSIGSTSDVIQIYSGGIYNYGASFNTSKVTAGQADSSTPTTLSTYGSFALRGKFVYGLSTYTLTENETMVYVDASASNLCTGTPTNACSAHGSEGVCTSHSGAGCSWTSGNSCTEFSATNQGTCESHSGCTFSTASCSGAANTDSSTCEGQNGSYGGTCAWDTSTCPSQTSTATCNAITGCTASELNVCSVFTDTSSCNGQTGCSAVVDGDCSSLSDGGGDGTNCATQPECSYESGSGTCSGSYFTSCSGNYFDSCSGNLCNGNYFTGDCTGTYGAGCIGTASCGGFSSSGTCAGESGCTWSSGMQIVLPQGSVANRGNTSRMYSIMNIGSTGTVTVIANTEDTLQSSISMSTQYQQVMLHHHNVSMPCSIYSATDQPTCENGHTGCSWVPAVTCSTYNGDESNCLANGCSYSDPNCTGAGSAASCNGTYTSAKKWFKHNTI